MAEIKGITFSNQAVTPKDDGQLRAHILRDGIISGCAMAYSAATFSIAPGMLIAAGRCMRIPATAYKAADQATSGYARVLLTIDLTATATTSEFEQAQLSVDYSPTMGGFPSLIQGDINGNDTTYQVVLAVMTLSPGGITGFAEMLSRAVNRLISRQVNLSPDAWGSNHQTVPIADVAADSNVVVSPAPSSFLLWCECQLRAIAQSAGTLTFQCEEVPGEAIAVNILIAG